MADPIRERILKVVQFELEQITTANGFEQDVRRVHRNKESVLQQDQRPALSIIDRGDLKRRHIRLAYENTMQLEILAFTLQHTDDKRLEELARLHADVEKVVATHEKWNDGGEDLAHRTFVSTLTESQQEVTQPYGTTLTILTILYRVQEKNPYALRSI